MLIAGLLLIALGAVAVLFPLTAGISAEYFYGAILIAAAIIHFFSVFNAHKKARIANVVIAVVFLVIGILLILYPLVGLFSIALLTGVGFFVQGIFQIVFAFASSSIPGRRMLGVSGAVGVIAGAIILYGWPFDSAWVFGVVLGVNLIIFGLSALSLRNADAELAG